MKVYAVTQVNQRVYVATQVSVADVVIVNTSLKTKAGVDLKTKSGETLRRKST